MLKEIFLIIVLGSSSVESITKNNHYNVIIDHLNCKSTGTICIEPICNLTTVKRHEKLITIGCNFTEPTYSKLVITYNIKRNGVYRPTIIDNIEMDFCAFNDGQRLNAFIQLLTTIKSFRTNSSLFEKCPYQGFIGVHELLLDSNAFPEFVPPGLYRLDGKAILKNGTVIMVAKLYCEVKPKGAFVPE